MLKKLEKLKAIGGVSKREFKGSYGFALKSNEVIGHIHNILNTNTIVR